MKTLQESILDDQDTIVSNATEHVKEIVLHKDSIKVFGRTDDCDIFGHTIFPDGYIIALDRLPSLLNHVPEGHRAPGTLWKVVRTQADWSKHSRINSTYEFVGGDPKYNKSYPVTIYINHLPRPCIFCKDIKTAEFIINKLPNLITRQ